MIKYELSTSNRHIGVNRSFSLSFSLSLSFSSLGYKTEIQRKNSRSFFSHTSFVASAANTHTHKQVYSTFQFPTMVKSIIIIEFLLIFFVTLNNGKPHKLYEQSSSSTAVFLKPKANIMRRLNPLKLLFTVAYVPENNPHYYVEWNFPLLKTMLLESSYVTDEDKALFITEFSNQLNDYAHWSEEKRNQLERFTEKYFNVYKSPDAFLPFIDCSALTYALTDEMINDLQPNIDERKRADIRAKAVGRLCDLN